MMEARRGGGGRGSGGWCWYSEVMKKYEFETVS